MRLSLVAGTSKKFPGQAEIQTQALQLPLKLNSCVFMMLLYLSFFSLHLIKPGNILFLEFTMITN